jgi:solute carrier family 25 phosphate transporter 23/24/25/41
MSALEMRTSNTNTPSAAKSYGFQQQIPESTQFYLSETPTERDYRIRELFNTLDKENRGLLDSKAIQQGFTAMTHLPARTKYANELLSQCDTSHDGLVDFEEFKTYVNEKENELWQLFTELDRSGEGQLDPTDLHFALRRAGMEIYENDVIEFMRLMDLGKRQNKALRMKRFNSRNIDGNGLIDFNEFKNFLLVRVF